MTNRFKNALDWYVRYFEGIYGGYIPSLPHHDAVQEALTLATEAEQLRNERDELASALNEYYIMYGDRSIISRVDDLLEKAGILND